MICARLEDGLTETALEAVPVMLGDDDGDKVAEAVADSLDVISAVTLGDAAFEAVSEALGNTGLELALTGLALGLRVFDGDGVVVGVWKVPKRRRSSGAVMEKFCRLVMFAQPHAPLSSRVVMRKNTGEPSASAMSDTMSAAIEGTLGFALNTPETCVRRAGGKRR
jgi:hypothetical protein